MNINAIQPDGPEIAIEGQAFGEQPVNVTPEGIQPAEAAAAGEDRKVLTNGDRYRNMSDEELANYYFDYFFHEVPYCSLKPCACDDDCAICLLNWLKSPAEDDRWAS